MYRKKANREEGKSTHYKQIQIYNSHNGLENCKYIDNLGNLEKYIFLTPLMA